MTEVMWMITATTSRKAVFNLLRKKALPLGSAFFLCFISLFAAAEEEASGQWHKRFKIEDKGETLILSGSSRVEAGEKFQKVILLGGQLEFGGEAEEIIVLGGSLKLLPLSKVQKSVTIFAGKLERMPNAYIAGEQVFFQAPDPFIQGVTKVLNTIGPWIGETFLWAFLLFLLFYSWVEALLLKSFFPRFFEESHRGVLRSGVRNFFVGLFFLCALPLLLLLSLLTVIGLPLMVLFVLFFFHYAWLTLAAWLGGKFFFRSKQVRGRSILVGLSALFFAALFLPQYWLLYLAFWLLALGSSLRVLWSRVFHT